MGRREAPPWGHYIFLPGEESSLSILLCVRGDGRIGIGEDLGVELPPALCGLGWCFGRGIRALQRVWPLASGATSADNTSMASGPDQHVVPGSVDLPQTAHMSFFQKVLPWYDHRR